jgi:hypothetical protein
MAAAGASLPFLPGRIGQCPPTWGAADRGVHAAICAACVGNRAREIVIGILERRGATQDADLVLALEGLPIQALAEQLRDTFVVDAQLALETVTGSRRVLARARHAPFDVELFRLTDDPHDREPFARRRFVEVLGWRVGMPTAEDVIINKLRWWQREHRRKDFEDARNVLTVQHGALDEGYRER